MPPLRLLILLLFLHVPLSYSQTAGPGKTALHPMDPQEWFGNYQIYNQASQRLHESDDSAEHYSLGQWAWNHGLEDEAWEQWILAVNIDPDHAASLRAMGFVEKTAAGAVRAKSTINGSKKSIGKAGPLHSPSPLKMMPRPPFSKNFPGVFGV